MGRKPTYREEYIISKFTTNCNICRSCPCRLFNDSGVIRYGKGNLFADNVFILPPYNTEHLTSIPVEETLIYDIISKLHIPLEECYITRSIKCYSNNKSINLNSVDNCFPIIIKEIKFIKPKRIICFGKESFDFPNYLRNTLKYKGDIFWFPSYMIKFYNEKVYNTIIKELKEKIII